MMLLLVLMLEERGVFPRMVPMITPVCVTLPPPPPQSPPPSQPRRRHHPSHNRIILIRITPSVVGPRVPGENQCRLK